MILTSDPQLALFHRKKFQSYDIAVDHEQNDKAKELKLSSVARPHMRAFHCAWWSVFVSFFLWFSISPLLAEIKASLNITKAEIWNSSIAGVCGTIIVRLIVGPLCDQYGPKILIAIVLCVAAIPTACLGFVHTATELVLVRLFVGIAGGIFVMSQYWTTSMFTLEIIGTANGLVGGWGNLGAGVTYMIVGSALFPLLKVMYDGDAEKAWRTVFVFPAVAAIATAIWIYRISDDTPKGSNLELKRHGCLTGVSPTTSFYQGCKNRNTWILFIQYGCCFGVQLTMNSATAMYFKDKFGLSTESAAAISSIFSWMLLFARALGGFASDMANYKYGMQGRIVVQTIFLICQGGFVILFGNTNSLGGAICILIVFSLFVDGASGSTYGIVPYIDSTHNGSIMGIVGAGGNVGAAAFGLMFQRLPYETAFLSMGLAAVASGFLSFFINIEEHSTMLRGDKVEDMDDVVSLKKGGDEESGRRKKVKDQQ